MNLFKKKEIIINSDSSFDIARYLEDAIKYGKAYKFKFNFTDESILYLDKLLLIYNSDLEIERPSIEVVHKMGTIFGIYLGEVIRRNWLFDYVWVDCASEYDHPVLMKKLDNNDSLSIDPVDECFHRIYDGNNNKDINIYFKEIQKKAIKHDL